MYPQTLSDIISPYDIDDFYSHIDSQRALLIPRVDSNLCELFSWDTLNEILATRPIHSPQLMLMKDGEELPSESYTSLYRFRPWETSSRLRKSSVQALLEAGATMVIRRADELWSPLARLAESMELTFKGRVQINVYASWGDRPGLKVHADDHDVFILQIAGEKRWKIFGRNAPDQSRSPMIADQPKSAGAFDDVIHAGNTLYLPKGWWHLVEPMNVASLHLTVGVYRANTIHLLEWVIENLKRQDICHRPLNRVRTPDQEEAHMNAVQQIIRATLDSTTIEAFLAEYEGRIPKRSRLELPCIGPE